MGVSRLWAAHGCQSVCFVDTAEERDVYSWHNDVTESQQPLGILQDAKHNCESEPLCGNYNNGQCSWRNANLPGR